MNTAPPEHIDVFVSGMEGYHLGCLYEKDDYRTITFGRFTLEWLADGGDALERV